MKRKYWRYLLLFWFTVSMNLVNTHIHHDLHEHSDCVKCFVHNHLGDADLPQTHAIIFEPLFSDDIENRPALRVDNSYHSFINPRAPPFSV